MKIEVWVKAGVKHAGITQRADGIFDIAVRERPTDGKANEAVIEALARHFGIPKSDVTLDRGASSRRKLFVIRNPGLIKKMKQEISGRLPDRAPK